MLLSQYLTDQAEILHWPSGDTTLTKRRYFTDQIEILDLEPYSAW